MPGPDLRKGVWSQTFDAEAFVHPEWKGNAEDGFDVALLRLDRKSLLMQPRLDLYKECDLDLDLISLEWEMNQDGVSPMGLQMASLVDRIPDNECKMMYPEVDLKIHMFCAGRAGQGSGKENEGGTYSAPTLMQDKNCRPTRLCARRDQERRQIQQSEGRYPYRNILLLWRHFIKTQACDLHKLDPLSALDQGDASGLLRGESAPSIWAS